MEKKRQIEREMFYGLPEESVEERESAEMDPVL